MVRETLVAIGVKRDGFFFFVCRVVVHYCAYAVAFVNF